MKKINSESIPWDNWTSAGGKFSSTEREISVALGRDSQSMDLTKRQPFDVTTTKIPPGFAACPFHSHSAQWEFYHFISGQGKVRHDDGSEPITAGDNFIFGPGEAHQIINDSDGDLVLFVVADNPIGESCHYPDSKKWQVRSPQSQLIRSEPLKYLDGEE